MMKRILFVMLSCFFFLGSCKWISGKLEKVPSLIKAAGLDYYGKKNLSVTEGAVVFMGDSFTERWVKTNPDFFTTNNYIGRGIGGQSSSQLLLRFRQDVIDLKPSVVVISCGTNDIAENIGPYSPMFTLGCIQSMAELADYNGITVILSSVLPAGEFWWKPEVSNVPEKIDALNSQIKAYAETKGYAYMDYNSHMRDEKGALTEKYGEDGAHPSREGYTVMEKLAKETIDRVSEKPLQ